jgi:carnitine O-acetyltransferase
VSKIAALGSSQPTTLPKQEEPTSKKQASEIFWTGGLTAGHNRWFDKSIQLICTNNGKAGMTGEHSMMDGMPVVGFCDFITKKSYGEVAAESGSGQGYEAAEKNVKNIFEDCLADLHSSGSNAVALVDQCEYTCFHCDDMSFCQRRAHHCACSHIPAKANFDKLISDHEMQTQSFQGYGSSAIKKMGYSPDAYVQMAMQLATYRLWSEQGGTYEATQVRPFLHGRTETTRTVSPASEAFVKTMGLRPKRDEMNATKRKEKLALLKDAVGSHAKYIGNAAKAMGVDRHLLGLALSVQSGEKAPDLLSHPLTIRSKTWRVSTSHLTHPRFDSWGYGEVTPKGVGLAYSIHPNSCMFCITALKEHGWPERLSYLLEEALLEMQALNELEMAAPASKL